MTSEAPRPTARLRGVYAITDARLTPPPLLLRRVEQALLGGVALVQYRDKSDDLTLRREQALALAALCRRHDALFIVNDDVALAAECGAGGVHLGADDAGLEEARARLGPGVVIGASCYDSLALAREAAARGADYVAFGSFFPSPVKPQAVRAPLRLLEQARRELPLPLCAIGGITAANAGALLERGADMLAVISAIFAAPDPRAAARTLRALFPPPPT